MWNLVTSIKPICRDVESAAFVDFCPSKSFNFGMMNTEKRSFRVGVGSCLRNFIHGELLEDMEHVWGVLLVVVVVVGGRTIGRVTSQSISGRRE